MGGLALAKPATVHAADTGSATTTAAPSAAERMAAYSASAEAAANDYGKQLAAERQVQNGNQEYNDLVKAGQSNTQAATDAVAKVADGQQKLAAVKSDIAAQQANMAANKHELGVGDVTADSLAKDKSDLDAANATLKSATDAHSKSKAAWNAALKQKFGFDEDHVAENFKNTLTTFKNAYKGYKEGTVAENDMLLAGIQLDKDTHNIPNNGIDYKKLGEIYYQKTLDDKAYLTAQKKASALNDKYTKELAIYNADKYAEAIKSNLEAQNNKAIAEDAFNKAQTPATLKARDDARAAAKASDDKFQATKKAYDAYKASNFDATKAPVIAESTTPSTPVTPTTPVTPSDNNNNTNNNTQAQTLYVSYSEHPTWKVATLNDNGVYTDNYVDQNTAITVMQSKTVNGELLYKIADNQWIPAKYTAKQASANAEEAASGVATLNEVPGHPTWKINMLDASGHYTNVYLNPNTAWKVFGKKTINGEVCYRLGSQSQWVPAKYLSLN